MSCNHCGIKFNFFHKEMGCANCGLTFCNKCLKQKCKVPNKGSSELPVCRTCFQNQSQDKNANRGPLPPPDAYLKRMEALENPATPPITIYKKDTQLNSLRNGLSPADQQLLDRLEKLRYGKSKLPPPSETEIHKRLKTLKGENEYVVGPSKATVFTADTRSDQEKVDSLLEQFMQERDIELAHNPEEGIVARLANLREQGVRPNEGPYMSNLHDSGSDEEIDKITKKIMDEVALEEKTNALLLEENAQSIDDNQKNNSSPQLPWCVLCNKDAVVHCLDCDDLYCAECNTEVHQTWGDTEHRVVQYKPK